MADENTPQTPQEPQNGSELPPLNLDPQPASENGNATNGTQQPSYSSSYQPSYQDGYQQQGYSQSYQAGYQQPYQQSSQAGYQQTGYQQTGYQQGYGQAQQSYQQGYQSYQQPYQNGYQTSGYQQGDVYQPQYTTPVEQPPSSLGNWIGTLILTAIPIVNIIMLIIWAASSSTETSKKHWAQAQLILTLIGVVLSILAVAAGVFTVSDLIAQMG